MVILLLGLLGLALSVYACIFEAFYEKDWPRKTFKFVALFTVALLIFVWS